MAEMLHVKELKEVYSAACIARRVQEMAQEIDAVYKGEPLVAVCVLKGAFAFFSDLVRNLHDENLEVEFIRISSYGKGGVSSGNIVFSKDVEVSLEDKHVLIVEDVVDSGLSMRFLLAEFAARKPRSLRLATLVDKHERRLADVHVDFSGFLLNQGFIVGYGIDYAERYRMLPSIYEVVAE